MTYPENFRYTKEHEWVRVDGDTGTVGITDHAQAELGDIVYVDFKLGRETLKPGDRIKQGESFGSVESVKAVSDIYSPVSGEVVEINQTLADAPEKLNQDPHGGHLFVFRGRRCGLIKVLWHDGPVLCLYAKRWIAGASSGHLAGTGW